MRKLALLVALAAFAPLALAACGGDDDGTTSAATTTTTQASGGGGGGAGGAGGTLSLAADPTQLAYDTDSLDGKAGKVTIDLDNPSATGHDVCVKDTSEKEIGCSDVVQQSNTSLSVNLKPGTYTFYCSVPGHEAAGMEGTLNVN